MAIESGDKVSFEYIGRFEDGSVFDTSRESLAAESGLKQEQPNREYEPLTIEVGTGQVIEGLDNALIGMTEGEDDTVRIPPEKAYGNTDAEKVREFDATQLREVLGGEAPREGDQLQSQGGAIGTVTDAGDQTVTVDFNHHLAGETLEFEVEIIDVR